MKQLLFLVRLMFGVAFLGLCLVSIAAFLGFVSPLLDAFNHLQPFLFIGTLVGFFLVLVLFSNHRARAGMLALAATGFLASAVIVIPEQVRGLFPHGGAGSGQQVIKIMSHNLFGLNYDMARMADIILREDPDIIALQEYFDEQREGLHPLITSQYPYFNLCAGRKQSHVALYSKMPFVVETGTRCAQNAEAENNPVARIVARFTDRDDTDFVVVTTHLNWPVQINPLLSNDLDFGQKLVAMTARKQLEWLELSTAIAQIEVPHVLIGDFNSTSWSYALRQFNRTTGLTRYSHGLFTYPKLYFIRGWRETPAFLPIDHMMASDGIQVQLARVGDKTGSDHLPLYAQFTLTAPE